MYENVRIHLLKLPIIAERITERRISNRKMTEAVPCPCMYTEACWVQLGQMTSTNWNHLWSVASHWKGDYCTPRPH